MQADVRALLRSAARPYLATGLYPYFFARGKLGYDPVFVSLLRRGAIPEGARIELENAPVTSENEDIRCFARAAALHMDRILDSTFETRRAEIWKANRRWVFASAAAVALVVMFAGLANAPRDLAWALALGAGGLLAVTVTRIVRALNTLYRCPNCGVLPYQTLNEYKCGGLGPTRSNFMSPTHCPKCGTRLR